MLQLFRLAVVTQAVDWKELPIAMIDFEGDARSGVVEFGVVRLSGGVIADTRGRLCRVANDAIRREAYLLHGIRATDTTGCAPFADEWAYFRDLRKAGLLGAHHATVEHALLKQCWPYPGLMPDFAHGGGKIADWGPWIDTRALYQAVYPQLQSHSLGELVAVAGLQRELDAEAGRRCPPGRCRYHCALYDALASAILLLSLAARPGFSGLTVEWLLEFSASSSMGMQARRQQTLNFPD